VRKINKLGKRDLNQIRKHLTRSQKDAVILQCGLSASLVEKVLLGQRNNELIVQYALVNSSMSTEAIQNIVQKLSPTNKLESLTNLLQPIN
jgi:hypothetical protein